MADRIKNYQQEADQITTLKAIRTDLSVTPSSYTPDATVVTKDRVVTFAQAEEELVVLSDIEKGVKQQVAEVDIAQKDIANIKALLQGHLYDYQTDSTSAYTKSVPAGAMPYAGLEKVGGETIVMNQLCGNSVLPSSVTYIGDGTYKINGTISDAAYPILSAITTVAGHKYYLYLNVGTIAQNVILYNNGQGLVLYGSDIISTAVQTATGSGFIFFKIDAGTYNNVVVKAKTIDLTMMFGSGNEPSTTTEVELMFLPDSMYSYNEGSLLSAGVTEVVSKDGNNATLQTYSIPAEVQALEGYGWSCHDHYNYIDYEAKKFVQEVGSRAYASGDESDSTVITDGTTTYYPLNPAIETDISEYLTDDNLINVESGGTLTFPNSNGDDYRIPVPSEETYMIDLQEAINNG